jgi:hypothetical protein
MGHYTALYDFSSAPVAEGMKKRQTNLLSMQNIVVEATFLDFQANIFPLLFKPNDRKFPIQGFQTWRF